VVRRPAARISVGSPDVQSQRLGIVTQEEPCIALAVSVWLSSG
jgi:hypothetical protein